MPAPVFQALGSVAQGTGSIAPNWPAHQADDIALLVNESDGGANLSTPSGFALVGRSTAIGSGTNQTQCDVWWCRATSSSMVAPVVGDAGDHNIGYIVTARGCITTGNPWNIFSTGQATTSTATSAPGNTTTLSNTLTFYCVTGGGLNNAGVSVFGSGGPFNSNLPDLTLDLDFGSAVNNNGGASSLVHGTLSGIGDTGTVTGTSSGNDVKGWVVISLISPSSSSVVNTGNFFMFMNRI